MQLNASVREAEAKNVRSPPPAGNAAGGRSTGVVAGEPAGGADGEAGTGQSMAIARAIVGGTSPRTPEDPSARNSTASAIRDRPTIARVT